MADEEIVINSAPFFERLSHFYNAWKNDKRSTGDQVFGGVGAIVVVAGKSESESSYQKNNALHVGSR